MKAAMTTLNQLQYFLVLLRLRMQCIVRVFTPRVKSNDTRCIPMKVDSGADTCFLTTDDLQKLGLCLDFKPCNAVLKRGGNTIFNLGISTSKITFKGNSASVKFNIVDIARSPAPLKRDPKKNQVTS